MIIIKSFFFVFIIIINLYVIIIFINFVFTVLFSGHLDWPGFVTMLEINSKRQKRTQAYARNHCYPFSIIQVSFLRSSNIEYLLDWLCRIMMALEEWLGMCQQHTQWQISIKIIDPIPMLHTSSLLLPVIKERVITNIVMYAKNEQQNFLM